MIRIKERKTWFALLALLLLFAACKGETPTAPPPGTGIPPGGTTPPLGATLVLTTSNASPLVDNTVVITATVTENGQPAPNGTAVELTTSGGTFTNVTPGVQAIIRTTTNGIATVNLTSPTPVLARVTATVNNITRTIDVNFRAVAPCVPPDPLCPVDDSPTITSVSPARGRPEGGQILRITGTNFIAPVRVLFDVGAPSPAEGLIVASTLTTIDVLTPAISLGAAQQFLSDITVISRAGQANERRVTRADAFTFENVALTPVVFSLSPTSGAINGGTRVTIFGEGFQAPLQVFFGSAEAQVVEVQFGQIIVMSPDARSTNPNGSGTVTGPVPVSVVNIRSNTRATSPQTFRYVAAMQITAAGPTQGPATGGTRVTIDGIGFDAPVAVSIGGVAANPVFVSGTQVIAITAPVRLTGCADVSGPIIVTNVENGDQATGPTFIYQVPKPAVIGVSPSEVSPGGSVTVLVANAQPGVNRITINGRAAFITSETINATTGIGSFTVTLPTTFTFPTESCVIGSQTGTRQLALQADVTYTNVQSTCSDTADDALTINPCSPMPCACVPPPAPPAPEVTLLSPPSPACAEPAPNSATNADTTTASITFQNDGGQPLTIVRGAITGTNAADFAVSPSGVTIAPGQTGTFTVTFNPTSAVPPNPRTASVNFTTNDADEGSINVCLQSDALP